jgi:hypothetical protein
MMRRLAGSPVGGENFYKAEIEIGRVGAEQHRRFTSSIDASPPQAATTRSCYRWMPRPWRPPACVSGTPHSSSGTCGAVTRVYDPPVPHPEASASRTSSPARAFPRGFQW